MATIINPTLTNEFQFGYTVNGIPGDPPPAGSPYYRAVSNINIPLLYPAANISGVIPNFNFGGTPTVSGTQLTSFAGTPYANRNPVWNYIDNVTKVKGNHTIKAGIYYEYAVKTENAFKPYNGTIDFGRDSNNPGDTNWAFSNALLGNYASYQQINKRSAAELSVQEHRVLRAGHLESHQEADAELRPARRLHHAVPRHAGPDVELRLLFNYDPAQAVQFYQPYGAFSGRVARRSILLQDRFCRLLYIGAIVPGRRQYQ